MPGTSTGDEIASRLADACANGFRAWWQRRVPFAISLGPHRVCAVHLFLHLHRRSARPPYFPSSIGWNWTRWICVFASGPDRYKHPDPRIVIVDIDQRSQEILGRWPFSRTHFAHMLDALREDGAKVAAFDITFSKPDETAAPIRELRKTVMRAAEAGRAAPTRA